MSVHRVIDVIGTRTQSWEDAAFPGSCSPSWRLPGRVRLSPMLTSCAYATRPCPMTRDVTGSGCATPAR